MFDLFTDGGMKLASRECNSDLYRWCNKCGKVKPLEEFAKDKNKVFGKAYCCNMCTKKRNNKFRFDFSIKVGFYFNNTCFICKLYSEDSEIFDCHHLNPTKKYSKVSSLTYRAWDSLVVPELEKCVYLCALCHRRLHFGRFDDLINSGELVLIPGKAGVGRGYGKD